MTREQGNFTLPNDAANLARPLEGVHDEETFLNFLLALRDDRERSIVMEHAKPSSPVGPDAGGWENTKSKDSLIPPSAGRGIPSTAIRYTNGPKTPGGVAPTSSLRQSDTNSDATIAPIGHHQSDPFIKSDLMRSISSSLTNTFSDVDRSVVESWRAGLPEEAREEVGRLCDERLDKCFFGVVADERDHIAPKVHGGRFVADDDAWGFDEWGPSYFDHLLSHPELVLVYDPAHRTFHTGCTRHPAAQECWSCGSVPKTFACPFASNNCLMQPLIGRQIRRAVRR